VKTNLLVFTKGRPTRRTWYYDLSGGKVGKKQPLTLAHFGFGRDGTVLADDQLPAALREPLAESATAPDGEPGPMPSFARLLPARGTPRGVGPLSWTIDISARRAKAREEMAPHLAEAERHKLEAVSRRARLAALRRAKAPEAEQAEALAELAAAEREAREAQARADAIDAAVYDLKAVNPHARAGLDNRTPEQVLAAIAAHQRTIDSALGRLARLLAEPEAIGPSLALDETAIATDHSHLGRGRPEPTAGSSDSTGGSTAP
jgi:type I restriction enzyme M protein